MNASLFTSLHPQLPCLHSAAATALDLGCGEKHVFADAKNLALRPFGADIAPVKNGIPVAACKGEALPFADGVFDLVIARVALPYMHIPSALREIYRVLAPGGRLWATLHLPRMARKRIVKSLQRFDAVDVAYQTCALLNGALLRFTDLQIPWLGRFESVQFPDSFQHPLMRAGFIRVQTEIMRDESGLLHFAASAYKQSLR